MLYSDLLMPTHLGTCQHTPRDQLFILNQGLLEEEGWTGDDYRWYGVSFLGRDLAGFRQPLRFTVVVFDEAMGG